jgi:hypothetical protein
LRVVEQAVLATAIKINRAKAEIVLFKF